MIEAIIFLVSGYVIGRSTHARGYQCVASQASHYRLAFERERDRADRIARSLRGVMPFAEKGAGAVSPCYAPGAQETIRRAKAALGGPYGLRP